MKQDANWRSKLMRMSWIIQRNGKYNRSRALIAAWMICLNEDVVIQHVSLRLNHNKRVPEKKLNQIRIFS